MRTLLIVEDNPDLLRILRELLSRDFDVITAQTGEDALALIEEGAPDAVILDMQLPGMDGIETGCAIKERLAPRHVPILALTARAGRQEERRALDRGCCDAYMTKPAPLLLIRNRLNELLEPVESGAIAEG